MITGCIARTDMDIGSTRPLSFSFLFVALLSPPLPFVIAASVVFQQTPLLLDRRRRRHRCHRALDGDDSAAQ